MTLDNNERTVLITGSSRGIGRAAALAFAREGYNVVLNCFKNEAMLTKLAREIRKFNPSVIGFKCDVSDYKSVKAMFDDIEEVFGGADVVVNNAGVSFVGLFQDMTEEEMRRVIDVNLMGVLNVSRLAVPYMIKKKRGVILNVSSVWGRVGASCEAVYSASKGGVDAFTKALAKELAPSGIRVNGVSCGVIDTEMNNNLTEEEKAELACDIPLMRFGRPSEIADILTFLASDKAAYINGEVLRADGGYL